MGMAAFADNNLLNVQLAGNLNLFERYPGELDIILPDTVVGSLVKLAG